MHSEDYERISRAIAFVRENARLQPSLEQIAAQIQLSPHHFQRLFSRWAGVTPKRYLQVLTLERAKDLLASSRPLLDLTDELGLSSASRLHDHFVQLEAMTPGEYRDGGAGLTIEHAWCDTPFGRALLAMTARGICRLEFVDDDPDAALAALRARWPSAHYLPESTRARQTARTLLDAAPNWAAPLSLHVSGTNFQVAVWKALLRIPAGGLTSYSRLAAALGRPAASRAVGTAVGANPVAVLIPCHRVIRETGELGGYRWGLLRKQAIHCRESMRLPGSADTEGRGLAPSVVTQPGRDRASAAGPRR